MLYLVSATLQSRELIAAPHEQFREMIQKVVVPSFDLLLQFQAEGKILAGGMRASSPDLVFILDLPADSHLAVRRLLFQLPIFGHYRWEVTPLESFKECSGLLHG